MARPITLEEREYLEGILAFEKRAVLPLKWLILIISLVFLVFPQMPYWNLPAVEPFILFLLYFLFNLTQSYFFYFSRVGLDQTPRFVTISYLVDLVFVTGLLYFDGHHAFGREMHDDLYVFFFLIVLRGTAIFRTSKGKLAMNVALSAVFIMAAWQTFGQPDYDILRQKEMAMKLALIWMVMLVSWFIIDMLNRQAEKLVAARERLLRSENLATVGGLAAGVAHEINNPIGIILANCEYLLRLAPADDQRREDFEAIHKEALRVKSIVAELMDLSKPQAESPVECDAKVLNEEILAFAFGRQDSNMEVDAHYETPLPPLWADPNRIKQALLNIYLNAEQASGKKGRIEIAIAPAAGGRQIKISIADEGCGINDEALARIFEPFFTTRAKGTGLGLTVTRRIVEDHGGTIEISRRRPRGTLVVLTLPAAD